MDTEIKILDQLSLSKVLDQEAELIPLMTEEDEERLNAEAMPDELAILPLRNTVLFPGVVIPITVGRDKSIKLIKEANDSDKIIGVVAQKDALVEDPKVEDLNITGTLAKILRTFRMPDGNTTVIIQGQKRFDIQEFTQEEPFFKAKATTFQETKPAKGNKEFAALVESVKDVALQIIKDSPNIPSEASFAIKNIESDSFLVNFVASNMNIDVKDKQKLLEQPNLEERTKTSLIHLNHEINMIQMNGPDFDYVDNRLLSLYLVRERMTDAVIFSPDGVNLQPSDVLYKKNILAIRGSFRPVTKVNIDMIKNGYNKFILENRVCKEDLQVLFEITLSNLSSEGEIDEQDFLDRADILCSLGQTVLISNYQRYYKLLDYFSRFTKKRMGIIIGVPNLKQIFEEKYYRHLSGGILEAFGRMFNRDLKIYLSM